MNHAINDQILLIPHLTSEKNGTPRKDKSLVEGH